jgi:hypothetical protein
MQPMLNPFMQDMMRSTVSGGSLWTPAQITTAAWYDASDDATITESGGSVSQWDDKSGNMLHVTQGTASNQPETGSRTINGLNVLDFVSDKLSFGSALPLARNVPGFFIIAVCEPDTSSGGDILTQIDDSGGAERCKHQIEGSKYSGAGRRLDSDVYQELDATFAFTFDPVVFGTIWDYANAQMNWTVNGTLDTPQAFQSAGNTSDTDAANFHIGGRGDTAQAWDGTIAEVIYLLDLTTNTRQLLEGYLAWKWGLEANLPSGHPYKNSPPTV